MDILKNWCWCSESNWDLQQFNCQIILTIKKHNDNSINWREPADNSDWERTTIEKKVFDKDTYEVFQDLYEENPNKRLPMKKIYTLKPEVIDWLNENIEDVEEKGETLNKGWAIFDETATPAFKKDVQVFFRKKSDALKFIRRWSEYKKPTFDWDYFKDTRKKLDFNAKKLVLVD